MPVFSGLKFSNICPNFPFYLLCEMNNLHFQQQAYIFWEYTAKCNEFCTFLLIWSIIRLKSIVSNKILLKYIEVSSYNTDFFIINKLPKITQQMWIKNTFWLSLANGRDGKAKQISMFCKTDISMPTSEGKHHLNILFTGK